MSGVGSVSGIGGVGCVGGIGGVAGGVVRGFAKAYTSMPHPM